MSARKDGLPLAPGEKDGRPPAPDSSAPRDLESDLERLAVPHRSLFESDADVACEALLGTHRANPLSVLAEALKMASGLVALVAFGLAGDFFGGDAGALLTLVLAAVGIFVVCLVLAFAIWRSRTWELMADGIRVCWGLGRGPFSRHDLTIPYDHIHTVSMSSTLVERLFGLMALDLDTGAARSEGDASKISGLRAGEAEALQTELFRRKRGASAGEGDLEAAAGSDTLVERPAVTYTLTRRQLLLAAASQMSAASQAVALVVLLAQGLNQLIEWNLLDIVGTGDELVATPLTALVPVVALFLVAALALGAAVSFALNLVRYAGFRVERYEDRLVVEHGLLSRASHTVALGRVQYVCVHQGIVRQLMGYAELQAVVVAAAGGEGDGPTGRVTLHPFLRMDELEAFLAEALPSYAGVLGEVRLAPLGPLARRRAVVRAVLWWPFAAAVVALLLWLMGLSGLAESAARLVRPLVAAAALASAVLLASLVADALRGWRHARFGHTRRELVLVSGGLTRLTVMVPRAHLQHMTLSANPFQRRGGVASLTARTAALTADGLSLRDLPAEAAGELLEWFRPRG